MRTREQLERIAADAGDAAFPGLWITSPTARYASFEDDLELLDGIDTSSAAEARAEIIEFMFELRDVQKRGHR